LVILPLPPSVPPSVDDGATLFRRGSYLRVVRISWSIYSHSSVSQMTLDSNSTDLNLPDFRFQPIHWRLFCRQTRLDSGRNTSQNLSSAIHQHRRFYVASSIRHHGTEVARPGDFLFFSQHSPLRYRELRYSHHVSICRSHLLASGSRLPWLQTM